MITVLTIDENKKRVYRNFASFTDLKKFLHHRKLFIRPKGERIIQGNKYKAYRVGSYLKDVTPRFNELYIT